MFKQIPHSSSDLSGIRTRQLLLPGAAGAPPAPSGSRTANRRSREYPAGPGRHNQVDRSEHRGQDRRDLILGLLIAAVLAAMVALAL